MDCNWTVIDIQPTLSSKEDDMEISYSCDQTVTAFLLNTDSGEKIDESFVITYSFNQTGQWTAKTTDSQELNVFTVEWNQDKPEWQTNLKSGILPEIWNGQIPDNYRPSLDLSKTNIDYTPTTNILFPGRYVFLADPVRPDSNYTQGLAAPHDLILTGDITLSV
ncbi:hypothetical protein ASPCADRAFT_10922 [Aspergillus carbonarius ITEM 5010]|uniref:Uncharacterized protein n=1 Tax=Aspergillus carbonarius (strain ITEM 5010) TaxID=602072 RepID=A0A1R3R6Q1_ASPC5|nr:hypothetical protein ASPCADRAFT_10922 [Aspergillus carbonarius ITEM 5010]